MIEDEKLPTEKIVTTIAIVIPRIPKKFPCLEVSGDDKPLKARIKSIPEVNKILLISLPTLFFIFLFCTFVAFVELPRSFQKY